MNWFLPHHHYHYYQNINQNEMSWIEIISIFIHFGFKLSCTIMWKFQIIKLRIKKNNFFFNKKKFFSAIGSFKPIKNVDCMNNNVPMWLKHCPYEYNDSRNHFLSSWLSIQKSYEIVLHFKKKNNVCNKQI
mgnify:CR=1 FL=1